MRLKICCIQDYDEIEHALKYGASEIGLVGSMSTGPGPITDRKIRALTERANHLINTVLLTSEINGEGIISHHSKVRSKSIQIVRELPISEVSKVKSSLPKIQLFQVVHVYDHKAIERAILYADIVDIILLDSGKPSEDVYGGTGKTHNWMISREIIRAVDKPVFLAGGLNQFNVQNAIATVQPDGIDVCSGLRSNGRLVEDKLRAFSQCLNLI